MIKDIVFEEIYAQRIQQNVNNLVNQAFITGRNQGWNEMLGIISELQENNLEINQENISKAIYQLIAEEQQVQQKSEKTQQQSQHSTSIKKPTLTLVR